ncbi:Mismatch repair protein msh3 [Linderina pennispora]|nr:Mismatch repair protein msh3 [Linderina pennispora]
MVDLERGLCRIRYQRATPNELLRILRSLDLAASLLSPGTEITEPRLLADVLSDEVWTEELRASVSAWKSQLDPRCARSGDKRNLFQSGALHGRVQEFHTKIAQVESELEAHADSVAQGLGVKAFKFKSISGIDYLVDVTNVKARTVPDDWVKISSTKTNSRFHTPFIVRKLAEREQYRELLASAANSAYSDFLGEITSNYEQLRRLVHALATFDALLSLATLASRDGYTKPEIVDSNEAQISLTGARHPVLSSDSTKPYVPNDIALGGPARAVILTGPNMGGKSSLIRTVALVCVMAQCGSYVPAEAAKLSIIDAIFTRMGASDDLMAGESTFMVEMRETAELMRQATPNSLVILDELGRGTSTHDGAAIAVAVLDYLARRRPLTLFVTHYAHLVDEFAGSEQIRSFHMSFLERTADDGISQLTFLYKLVEGGSHDSYGLNVARMAGLPSSLLQCAKDKAEWMKLDIDSKLAVQTARKLIDVVAKARQNV